MKGTKYKAGGGAMKGTKYMSMGGAAKGTKYMSMGGAAKAEVKANPGIDKMPASILAKLQAGLSPVSGGKTKSLAKAMKKKPAKKFPPKAR